MKKKMFSNYLTFMFQQI